MSTEARYIPFPLFLLSGIPGNLNDIFDYGIYKYSREFNYKGLDVVMTQVLYAYYRQELPSTIKKKLEQLIDQELFVPDEDYNGFSGDGFAPETGVEELLKVTAADSQFREECVRFWQMRQAMSSLHITGSIDEIVRVALQVEKQVNLRALEHKNDVTVMISISMMFDYYKKEKSDYEIDLLRAFLAIKSIIGNKKIGATNKRYILMRMTGAKNKQILEELLKNPKLMEMHNRYSVRYQMDRLLEQLLSRNFITGKLAFGRSLFMSTHYTTREMPAAVAELVLHMNTKTKRDLQKSEEKQARQELMALLKTKTSAA